MKKLSKEYNIVGITSLIGIVIAFVGLNLESIASEAYVWEFALIVAGGFVLTALVNMYILSVRLATIRKTEKRNEL